MIKILSFERAIAARAVVYTERYAIAERRRAAATVRNGRPLRLVGHQYVPSPTQHRAPKSKLMRLVRQHPVVIDALFVVTTLSAAALMWRAGW